MNTVEMEGESALGRHQRKEISIVEGNIENIGLSFSFPPRVSAPLPLWYLFRVYHTTQNKTRLLTPRTTPSSSVRSNGSWTQRPAQGSKEAHFS